MKKIKVLGSRLLLSFLFLFVAGSSYSQTKDDVGILRKEILNKMQSKDQKAEDLIKYYSKISPYEALVLNVKYLLLKGDYENALSSIFLLRATAEKDKDSELFFQYQCIYAQACQVLGLSSEVENTRKILQNSKFIKGTGFTDLALDQTDFKIFPLKERIYILQSSIDIYKKKNDERSLMQCYVWLAQILKATDPITSKKFLNKALALSIDPNFEIYYKILAENEQSRLYLEEKKADLSFELLQKYLKDINKISNIRLQLDLYKNLAQSSANVFAVDKLKIANDELVGILEQDNANKSRARAMLVNNINKTNDAKLRLQKQFFNNIYIGIIILFGIGILWIYIKYKRKIEDKKSVSDVVDVKNFTIPDKTEKRILTKLDAFEKSQKYIQKNISLKILAQQFDTNPKYLSEVVNNHKNSNFNTYINDLRIDYIVNKIRQDPEYRKYKVSYLADECGFSSHSLFTTIFKNRMNVSPTEFLQRISE